MGHFAGLLQSIRDTSDLTDSSHDLADLFVVSKEITFPGSLHIQDVARKLALLCPDLESLFFFHFPP